MNLFKGRRVCVATMHKKESMIGPLFEKAFEVTYTTADALNTDAFGTFSGEKERINSPIETARQKCLAAFDLTQLDLVIASEGSFGPHPLYGFLPCDEELVLLKDFKNDLEFSMTHRSTTTNFSLTTVSSFEAATQFLKQIGFPQHAVIIKIPNTPILYKGIDTTGTFGQLFHQLLKNHSVIHLETDMRAHYNPTRMQVIRETVVKLIDKIKCVCPACQHPGYSVTQSIPGLPCGHCLLPTRSTLAHVSTCTKCQFSEENKFPLGKREEDPMYCDFCNP